MEEREARKAAAAWQQKLELSDHWPSKQAPSTRLRDIAWRIVFSALKVVVPEDIEAWTVRGRALHAPQLYLVDEAAFYLVECAELSDLDGRARVRRVTYDGETRVEALTHVSVGAGFGDEYSVSVDWTFEFGDAEVVTLTSGWSTETDGNEQEDVFARALAARLGWVVPPP
jgi:hypothetical protein